MFAEKARGPECSYCQRAKNSGVQTPGWRPSLSESESVNNTVSCHRVYVHHTCPSAAPRFIVGSHPTSTQRTKHSLQRYSRVWTPQKILQTQAPCVRTPEAQLLSLKCCSSLFALVSLPQNNAVENKKQVKQVRDVNEVCRNELCKTSSSAGSFDAPGVRTLRTYMWQRSKDRLRRCFCASLLSLAGEKAHIICKKGQNKLIY